MADQDPDERFSIEGDPEDALRGLMHASQPGFAVASCQRCGAMVRVAEVDRATFYAPGYRIASDVIACTTRGCKGRVPYGKDDHLENVGWDPTDLG